MFDYSPEQCEAIKIHCENGNSLESFCAKIGVSPKVINEWYQEYPDFKEAVEMCPCLELYYWESQMLQAINHRDKDLITIAKTRIDNLLKLVTSPIKSQTYANFKDADQSFRKQSTGDLIKDYQLLFSSSEHHLELPQ